MALWGDSPFPPSVTLPRAAKEKKGQEKFEKKSELNVKKAHR